MQIPIFDYSIKTNAHYYCDAHVRKIPIEIAQMLCNCFDIETLRTFPLTQTGQYRKHSHYNHPLSKWIRESKDNFTYAYLLGYYLLAEYEYRFGKQHFITCVYRHILLKHTKKIISLDISKVIPIQAINPDFRQKDTVKAYRNYFIKTKQHIFKWTKRPRPSWIPKEI